MEFNTPRASGVLLSLYRYRER